MGQFDSVRNPDMSGFCTFPRISKTETDRSQQTVQTQIRRLLWKQSDQGLHCSFHLLLRTALLYCKNKWFDFYDYYGNQFLQCFQIVILFAYIFICYDPHYSFNQAVPMITTYVLDKRSVKFIHQIPPQTVICTYKLYGFLFIYL